MSMMRRRLLDDTVRRTAEGESMAVRSVARMRPGLSIYGKSHQNTVAGNQLLDTVNAVNQKFTITGVTVTNNGDGSFTVIGTPTITAGNVFTYYITEGLVLEEGQYTLSSGIACRIDKKDGTAQYVDNTFTFDSEVDESVYIYWQRDTNNYVDGETIWPMLNIGTTALPWEPYTEGQPSPNPDYPQEIESVGEEGEIEIEVYGGNLINSDVSSWNQSGWGDFKSTIFQLSDGIKIKAINGWNKLYYDVSGMNGKTLNLAFDYRQIESETTSPNVYEAFAIVSQNENMYPMNIIDDYIFVSSSPQTVKTHVSASFIARNYLCFFLRVNTEGVEFGETRTIEVTNIMLNAGDTELTYEPYKTPQTLTVSTPSGLHGIPVSSGGNYTDESGQQWISDEIDFKRGKYVKRVGKNNLRGCEANILPDVADCYLIAGHGITEEKSSLIMCTHFLTNGKPWVSEDGYISYSAGTTRQVRIFWTGTTAGNVTAFLKDNDVYVIYVLDTPIETDLTPEQITAYQSLHTNYPTTTVMNDSDAGMKLTYKTRKSLEVT